MKARNNIRQENKWDVTDFTAPKRICFQAWGTLTQLNVKRKKKKKAALFKPSTLCPSPKRSYGPSDISDGTAA